MVEGWWDFTICHEDCLSSVWWRAGGILPSDMKIALAQYGGRRLVGMVFLPSVMKIALAQYGGTAGGVLPSVMKIALAQYGGGLVGFYHLS